MLLTELRQSRKLETVGEGMFQLISGLYPICRSITGKGVRETLKIIREHIPLEVHEVATGTKVFDWDIIDAYIKDSTSARVVDFKESNLHVVSYSVPIHQRMPLSELKNHMFTLPEQPDWIPIPYVLL